MRAGFAAYPYANGVAAGVSGSAIVGTVLIGYTGVVPISDGIHTESYPVSNSSVTLLKQ